MRGRFHFCSAFFPHGIPEQMLVICFPCGILCGMVCFLDNEAALSPLFSALFFTSPEISDFLLALFFPFLLCAISLSAGYASFLLIICFGKAFLFSFFCFGLCLSLKLSCVVCLMVCLSSSVSLVLLYGFCRHHLASREVPSLPEVLSFFLVILVVGLLFYCRFIPAASVLLNF